MTGVTRIRSGCSPWAFAGCGCGLLAMLGIALIFFTLGFYHLREVTDARRDGAGYSACQQHMRAIKLALESYEKDFHHLPHTLDALTEHYLDTPDQVRCPRGRRPAYQYSPTPAPGTDPLVMCTNHPAEGPVVLLHNGKMRLSDDAFLGRKRPKPR